MKSIDISVREWFDKTYGNSYFSAQATVDYGMDSEKTIYIPFQYGYGSHSENVSINELQKVYPEISKLSIRELKENGILYRFYKRDNCLKREVKLFGIERILNK